MAEKKFLDKTGLESFWAGIKAWVDKHYVALKNGYSLVSDTEIARLKKTTTFIPNVATNGDITWTQSDAGKDQTITKRNIMGPQGPKGDSIIGPQGPKGDTGARGPQGYSVVDAAMSSTSTNPVQNKVINTALAGKVSTSDSRLSNARPAANSSVSLDGQKLTVTINGVTKSLTNTNTTYGIVGANGSSGLIKNGSSVTSASGYTACPIVSGVPYYKDTNTTYSLSSFGVKASAAELNYCDGVTSNIQTLLNNKVSTSDSRLTNSRPANGGNSTTVNGHTVNADVPSGAKFTDTDTWRPVTDSYSGTSTGTSLSQKGGNDLYNALHNGYASSAGAATKINDLTEGTSNAARPVYFAWAGDNTRPVYNNNFTYNPSSKVLSIGGNAVIKEGDSRLTNSRAANGGNSSTVAGLAVHGGRNSEKNKIVRTDGSGYIQCGYINSSSGDEKNNSNPSYVWGTNGSDSYLRTYKTSALNVNYASSSGTASKVSTSATMDSSYESGTWINSVSNAAINCKHSGYGGVFNAKVNSGRIALSTYPASDDNVYIGYATDSQISKGSNSFNSETHWNAATGIWYANGFANKSGVSVIYDGDYRLSNPRPASDVYGWAKSSTKPSYGWSEISSKPYYNYTGNDTLSIIKSNYKSMERNSLIGAYLGHGSASYAIGWVLTGYDSNPYCGFLVNNYGDDWHVIGSLSGNWTDRTLVHSGNIGSQYVYYASNAGSVPTMSTSFINGLF